MVNRRWWPLWLLMVCLSGWVQAAEITLRVEPDPPPAGESFQLIFTAEGAVDDEPDFAPLARDFQILSRNQQTAITLSNGRHTRSTTWTVTVLPKQAGPLLVPPIRFGTLESTTRQIAQASATGSGKAADDDGLFLEVEASPEQPYVQQEVLYTIRLWRRYEISNASLSQPVFSGDVLVKPLDEERRYETTREGRRYEVVEKRFVLYPQVSGTLEIKPAEVTAQVVKRGFSLFDNFAQAMTTRRITSRALSLTVKPAPADFPGRHWLPARKLRLQAEWQPGPPSATVGEPLTRTVTLWADGLTAGQLPPLETTPPPGWKSYPERPLTNDQQEGTGFHGTVAQKTALIANQAGTGELAELQIPWWNTATDRLEYARLPAVSLRAIANSSVAATPPPAPPAAPVSASPQLAPVAIAPPSAPASGIDTLWRWIALISGAGWLATLLLWWLHTGRESSSAAPAATTTPAPSDSRQVLSACGRGETQEIASALLNWAAAHWPDAPPRSLSALAARVEPTLAAAILELDAARYGGEKTSFSAANLRAAWIAARPETSARPHTRETVLPKLYWHTAD